MGGTMKVPKHKHEKTLYYKGKHVCWCKFPFCKVISGMKEKSNDVILIAIYELIQKAKKGNLIVPLDNFIHVSEKVHEFRSL